MTEVFLISLKVKLIGAPGLSANTTGQKVSQEELQLEYYKYCGKFLMM